MDDDKTEDALVDVKRQVLVRTNGPMLAFTLANGRKADNMDVQFSNGPMDVFIRVNTKMAK